MSNERIVEDPKTGGLKGMKDERFELLPWSALGEVARVYGYGAIKYAEHNWRKGYRWSLSIGAMLRHIALYAAGQSYDSESGRHHMGHVVFHALTLITFEQENLGTDDRVREMGWKVVHCASEPERDVQGPVWGDGVDLSAYREKEQPRKGLR